VISFLHHNVVGLKATRPGYQEFVVQPTFDDRVPDVATTLKTPFGTIATGWRREGDAILVEVTAPALASGLIVLPDGREVQVPSGQTITATC
jgi:alpha-L-rhamnosidase